MKGEYDYDLFHPCRGGVGKIFVAICSRRTSLKGDYGYDLFHPCRGGVDSVFFQGLFSSLFSILFHVYSGEGKNVQVISEINHGCKIIINEQITSVNT